MAHLNKFKQFTAKCPYEDGTGYATFTYLIYDDPSLGNKILIGSPASAVYSVDTNDPEEFINYLTRFDINNLEFIPAITFKYDSSVYPNWTPTNNDLTEISKMSDIYPNAGNVNSNVIFDKPFIMGNNKYKIVVTGTTTYHQIWSRWNESTQTWANFRSVSGGSNHPNCESICIRVNDIEDLSQGYTTTWNYITTRYFISSIIDQNYDIRVGTNNTAPAAFIADVLSMPTIDPLNPYDEVPVSNIGGGDGTFDPSSDIIGNTYSTVMGTNNGGIVTVYTPTEGELNSLKSYLFSTSTSSGDLLPAIEGILNQIGQTAGILDSPTEYILSLYELPIHVPDSTKSTRGMHIGFIDTGITFHYTNKTLLRVQMGSVNIDKLYGNALDYNAVIQLYLPYIGYKPLDAKGVMGKTISIEYLVDLYTGNCVAHIKVNGEVLYQFNGNMAYQLPVGQSNQGNQMINGIGTAVSMIGMFV